MITASSNSKIKLVRSLQTQTRQRKNKAAFVIEGVRLVEEALAVNWPIDFLLYDQTLSDRGKAIITNLALPKTLQAYEITQGLMAEISDTETPQGILAVLNHQAHTLPADSTFIILADQIRDPGNLGTLLRTAEAAGADAVLLTPGTVDAYAPKVIRAGMGAHFHLPIHALPWQEIHTYLNGLPIFLAEASGGMTLWQADLRQPCVLLIGGEAFGASPMGTQIATQRVTIPMPGRTESFNAAVAAGILIGEVLRQRYQKKED